MASQLDSLRHARRAADPTGTATRASGGWPGTDSDEARAFLQRRVAGFALLVACIDSGFLLWRLANIASGREPWTGHEPGFVAELAAHTASLAVFTALWLFARGRPRSAAALRLVEPTGLFLGASALMLMAARIPYWFRPDFVLITALSMILIARSIYIPSSGRITLILGAILTVPLVICWYVMHQRGLDPGFYTARAPIQLRHAKALDLTIGDLMPWTGSVIIATAASRVIYGLREEVRDARRLGQYTLIEKLGQGGMGEVYRASHAMLRRPTAVKLLPPDKFAPDALARFEREVQLTALLTHPNTIRVFDYGRTPDDVFYYAMEFLDGASLAEVVRHTGPMEPARVIHVLAQVAGALVEAHGIGLIHRDIKPANILLTEQGGVADVAKVLDFGLVKDVSAGGDPTGETATALTHTDSLAGTPQYMAPEAITTPDRVDARADLYALGAVGYFLLTGKDVFTGRTIMEVCSHHLHTEPVPPSRRSDRPVPGDLERVILSCLAKAPDDRPADARALETALRACADFGDWDENRARTWWAEHGEAVRVRRGADGGAALGAASTMAVSLTARPDPPARAADRHP